MTMHINLSPEMENFIKSRVSSGFYGNATEVIRDAIRHQRHAQQYADRPRCPPLKHCRFGSHTGPGRA